MSAVVHNYAVRITRKLKKPDERGNEWVADEVINEIAFVEGTGRYNDKIDDLVASFKSISLPEDIMVELVHNWTGTLPEGCPWGIMTSLTKDGYINPSDATGWFNYDSEEKACSQKFYVQCSDDIAYFRYKLWNESSLSSINWAQSNQLRKAIESNKMVNSVYVNHEWWM